LLDDGEDSGVAADADGQRQDHGERKARAVPETTSRVSDVSRDIFCNAHRPLVVATLLEPRQIAELPPGGALRVDVAQPVTSVVACERIDMESHLALHVAIPRAPSEQCDYATNEARRSQGHVTPPARARAARARRRRTAAASRRARPAPRSVPSASARRTWRCGCSRWSATRPRSGPVLPCDRAPDRAIPLPRAAHHRRADAAAP